MANEQAVADHLLTTAERDLNALPRKVAPRPPLIGFSVTYQALGIIAFYNGDGCISFAMDIETLKDVPIPAIGGDAQKWAYEQWLDGTAIHDQADKANEFGVVYFIGCVDTAIKIGRSVDVRSRFNALQSCSPIKLTLLATRAGGDLRERAYHQQFAEHRLHGEWFRPHPELLAEIAHLTKATPDAS